MLITDTAGLPLEDGLSAEQAGLSQLFSSRDAADGIAAFIAKREPNFTGH